MKYFAILLLLTVGCQEVEQPNTVLTQDQWKAIQENILKEAPTPKYKVGANFDQKIELIGFDIEGELKAGKPVKFIWYWKALESIDSNWTVFVHLDSDKGNFRQNLDHVPVNDLYQTSRWKKGDIIKDVQSVTLKPDFPGGPFKPFIGFFKGNTRMPVANKVAVTSGESPRVIGPTLTMAGNAKASKVSQAAPQYALTLEEGDPKISVDGDLNEPKWVSTKPLLLQPLGNAAKLNTKIKAFVTKTDLYIGATLEDKHAWGTLKNRDDETWKEEVLEFFLDLNGDGADYLELQVTPLNTVFDAHFVKMLGKGEGSREDQIKKAKAFNIEGLQTAVKVDGTVNNKEDEDKSWTVEIRIPLKSVPGFKNEPKRGETWSANFYRFDRTDAATRAYAWSTRPRGNFHQVDQFGKLKIGGAMTAPPKMSPEMLKKIRENVNLQIQGKKPMKPTTPKVATPKPQ